MNAHVATAVAQSNRHISDTVTTSVLGAHEKPRISKEILGAVYGAATLALLTYWGSGVDEVMKRPQQH